MSFDWSEYQERIFDHIENGTGHGQVTARAGAGKTTTLVEGADRIPEGEDALFLAFNKHIEQELSRKLEGSPMDARTVHSLAYGVLADRVRGNLDVNKWKYYDIIDQYMENHHLLSEIEGHKQRTVRSRINRMLGLVRMQLADPNDIEQVLELAGHYGVVVEYNEWIYDLDDLLDTGAKVGEFTGEIDFDDMVYLPIRWDLPFPKFDRVFVDEAQDLNAVQREIVGRSLKDDGRCLWVGDPKQAIYGFAGASTDAFEQINGRHEVEQMPLSICYRSPESHIDLVRSEGHVTDIEPAEDADEGTLLRASTDDIYDIVEDGDYVLCRTNAPLIKYCIRFIERRRKAVVLGRSLQRKLDNIVEEIVERTEGEFRYEDFGGLLEAYRKEELAKLRDRDAPESMQESLRDRVRCLKTCYHEFEDCGSVDELRGEIDALFSDDADGVTFMTVHKAKGDQNDRVHILRPDLLPLTWNGQKEWEVEQEWNLRYVAMTRSTDTLTLIEDEGPDEPEPILTE